jgi:hypothetical protein
VKSSPFACDAAMFLLPYQSEGRIALGKPHLADVIRWTKPRGLG